MLAGSVGALRSPALQRADVRTGDTIRAAGAPPLDRAVVATTDLGSLYTVIASSATLAACGRRAAAADVAGVGGIAWAVSQASKKRVRRARPYEADGVRRLLRPPTGSSFPSGHATVAAAISSVLAEHADGRGRKALALVGPYVAFTRVYAGVHYPTDVIGGAGLGYLLASGWRGAVRAGGHRTLALAGKGLIGLHGPAAVLLRRSLGARRHRQETPPVAAAGTPVS
jgi:membrane-associated phospholipid phosphatase